MKNLFIACLVIAGFSGCKEEGPDYFREISYNFVDDAEEWTGMFSDYPKGEEAFYELAYEHVRLPEPLDTNFMAVRITGNNHSDDLFSYMYAPVTSLAPNTTYDVTFSVLLASNVSTNSVGIGGSPDLSLGIGALDTVPVNILDESDYYRPNFEVKLQSNQSNEIMQVIGTLGVSDTTTVYTPILRHNYNKPMKLTSNGDGMLYLLLGWDSGFEGRTSIYIKTINVRIEYWGK